MLLSFIYQSEKLKHTHNSWGQAGLPQTSQILRQVLGNGFCKITSNGSKCAAGVEKSPHSGGKTATNSLANHAQKSHLSNNSKGVSVDSSVEFLACVSKNLCVYEYSGKIKLYRSYEKLLTVMIISGNGELTKRRETHQDLFSPHNETLIAPFQVSTLWLTTDNATQEGEVVWVCCLN